MRAFFLSITALLILASAPADARPRQARAVVVDPGCNVLWPCEGVVSHPRGEKVAAKVGFGTAQKVYRYQQQASAAAGTQMLPHPAGCPSRAFCGCGAAVEVFGTPRRDLWLAANWLKFPRAAPSSGMVAARRGHVFVLKQQLADGQWLVADYNSGGRASRLHVRSLRGYTVVNPRA